MVRLQAVLRNDSSHVTFAIFLRFHIKDLRLSLKSYSLLASNPSLFSILTHPLKTMHFHKSIMEALTISTYTFMLQTFNNTIVSV